MPRRSAPGNRLAIEAVLAPAELSTLRTVCAASDVPLDSWHKVPMIARQWELLAASRLMRRLQERDGFSEDKALRIAAGQLGLDGEVLRSRARRAFSDGRRSVFMTKTRPGVCV